MSLEDEDTLTTTEEDDVNGVIEQEDRLRELRERRREQRMQTDGQSDTSDDPDEPPRFQRGIVRDVTEDTSGYQDTVTLDVETEYGMESVSMRLPDDKYTLDNDFVTLLEWNGIDDGRFSQLLGERVYFDARDNEIVTPSSLSPVSRAATHLTCQYRKYFPEDEDEYMSQALGATLLNLFFMPAYVTASEQFGGIGFAASLVFLVLWSFILGPVAIKTVSGPVKAAYKKVREKWNERYHEI